jgi:hypothetical protein
MPAGAVGRRVALEVQIVRHDVNSLLRKRRVLSGFTMPDRYTGRWKLAPDPNRDGQYSLCGIPGMPGPLYMLCANDEVPYSRRVDFRADTVLDVDATRFHMCLEQGAAR